MQIANFGTFALALDGHTYSDAYQLSLDDLNRHGYEGDNHIPVRWDQVQGLINALQHVQRQRTLAEADGTVAAILLQGHNAAAPGDFG